MVRFQNYWESTLWLDTMTKDITFHPLSIGGPSQIILHCGVGSAVQDKRHLLPVLLLFEELTLQQPTLLKAVHSVSEFKVKAGMEVGVLVTLHKHNMYSFLDKFFDGILPFSPISGYWSHNQWYKGIDDVMNIEFFQLELSQKLGFHLLFAFKKNSAKLPSSLFPLP